MRNPSNESGAAVTIVPAVAEGGGVGLLVRKSGWMCSSDTVAEYCRNRGESLDAERWRVTGREKLGGKFEVRFVELLGGTGNKNGPSRALAGDGERDPGIGARTVVLRIVGEDRCTASRMWGATEDVSQLSKAESSESRCEGVLVDSEVLESRYGDCFWASNWVLDDEGWTAIVSEDRREGLFRSFFGVAESEDQS